MLVTPAFWKSPSKRNARVHVYKWGGCQTLCLAANFSRRNIYVIVEGSDGDNDWQCSLYRPSSISRCKEIIKTGDQLLLRAAECGGLVAQYKQYEDGQWPIVLHYACRHYSVYVHRRNHVQPMLGSRTCSEAQIRSDFTFSDVVRGDLGELLSTESVSAHEGVTDESMSEDHFDPWNTENGEEHFDELHEPFQELSNYASATISHLSH